MDALQVEFELNRQSRDKILEMRGGHDTDEADSTATDQDEKKNKRGDK